MGPLLPWLGEWGLAVEQHHERFDGTGYPHRLKGHEISLAARIVAVADAYEVMTAPRPYKRPMSVSAARQELVRVAGTQLDPVIVRAFLNVSVGRLWRTIGFGAWIAQIPQLARLFGVGQWASTGMSMGIASATTATVLAVSGVVGPSPGPVVVGPGLRPGGGRRRRTRPRPTPGRRPRRPWPPALPTADADSADRRPDTRHPAADRHGRPGDAQRRHPPPRPTPTPTPKPTPTPSPRRRPRPPPTPTPSPTPTPDPWSCASCTNTSPTCTSYCNSTDNTHCLTYCQGNGDGPARRTASATATSSARTYCDGDGNKVRDQLSGHRAAAVIPRPPVVACGRRPSR